MMFEPSYFHVSQRKKRGRQGTLLLEFIKTRLNLNMVQLFVEKAFKWQLYLSERLAHVYFVG